MPSNLYVQGNESGQLFIYIHLDNDIFWKMGAFRANHRNLHLLKIEQLSLRLANFATKP